MMWLFAMQSEVLIKVTKFIIFIIEKVAAVVVVLAVGIRTAVKLNLPLCYIALP